MADTMGLQMTGFRGEKSSKSQRVTKWNSKRDDKDALATREQGEKGRREKQGEEGLEESGEVHRENMMVPCVMVWWTAPTD